MADIKKHNANSVSSKCIFVNKIIINNEKNIGRKPASISYRQGTQTHLRVN